MPGEGPELICAVGARRQVHGRSARLRRAAGSKRPTRTSSASCKRRGLLFHQEQYLHEYPFCWRAEEDPLIQYPRQSWFIRTTQFKERMLANNRQINWLPEHIQRRPVRQLSGDERRLGPLARALLGHAAADLGLRGDRHMPKRSAATTNCWPSRACRGPKFGTRRRQANPELSDHLKVHKPYIDAVTYDSPFDPSGTDAPRAAR